MVKIILDSDLDPSKRPSKSGHRGSRQKFNEEIFEAVQKDD